MDFFEQIGKKLTNVGQGVAQQTKNFADVGKLNSEISEKEKRISQLYLLIGRLYYERHKKDFDAEEQQKIDEINQLYRDIMQCQEKIKQINGVVKCKNCGADVPIQSMYCGSCGSRVVFEDTQETIAEPSRVCPDCHMPVGKENLFCEHCGAKLEKFD